MTQRREKRRKLKQVQQNKERTWSGIWDDRNSPETACLAPLLLVGHRSSSEVGEVLGVLFQPKSYISTPARRKSIVSLQLPMFHESKIPLSKISRIYAFQNFTIFHKRDPTRPSLDLILEQRWKKWTADIASFMNQMPSRCVKGPWLGSATCVESLSQVLKSLNAKPLCEPLFRTWLRFSTRVVEPTSVIQKINYFFECIELRFFSGIFISGEFDSGLIIIGSW